MSSLENGELKSLNPSSSTAICSICLRSPLCPYSHTSGCAAQAESSSEIHIPQGHSGALAINVRISALHQLWHMQENPVWYFQGREEHLGSRPRQREIESKKRKKNDQLERRGGKTLKRGNVKERQTSEIQGSVASNFNFHWTNGPQVLQGQLSTVCHSIKGRYAFTQLSLW